MTTHLTQTECIALTAQFMKAKAGHGYTLGEYAAMLSEAERIRSQNVSLDRIISGRCGGWDGRPLICR